MKNSPDRQYAAKRIFEIYCNKREQIRKAAKSTSIKLSPKQEKIVVNAARVHFRTQELNDFKRWLCRFFSETNMYLTAIQIKAWPSMRKMQ